MSTRSWPSSSVFLAAAVGCCSLVYPTAVYAGGARVPALLFVLFALALLAITIGRSAGAARQSWRSALVVGGAALLVLAAFNGELAARSYPVVLSLGAAVAFGVSLLNPPSMIERFARVRDPDLSPAGQSYCRRVTLIWTAWLSANAAIAALLAVWGDDRAWALWTGLLSYIGMAVLLVGEWLVRPRDKLRGIAR